MKKLLLSLVKIAISLGIVGYLVWDATNRGESAFTDEEGAFQLQSFLNVVHHAAEHWWFMAAAWVVCAMAVLLTFIRWHYLVRALDLPFSFKDALRLGFLGYLFNLAPMGIVGGDLLKAVLLARRQHGYRAEAVATVFVDRVVGLYMLFVVASVAILATRFWETESLRIRLMCQATLVLTGIGTVVIAAALVPDLSKGRATRMLGKIPWVGWALEKLATAVQLYRRKLPVLAVASVMSVGVHSLFTVGIFSIACGLYEQVPSLGMHFVLSPVSAVTGVIPLPMGPFEYVLDRLYTHVPTTDGGAMAVGQGLVVAFGYRVITVTVALIGICYYLGSRREVAEVIHEEAEAG